MEADSPRRIQRKRTKGWRMPENTVSVCRPGRWGNPFVLSSRYKPGAKIGAEYIAVPTLEDAVECYRLMITDRKEWIEEAREHLRGKNLACFCALDQPCHADALLQIANAE
jgi:hypothetical protein